MAHPPEESPGLYDHTTDPSHDEQLRSSERNQFSGTGNGIRSGRECRTRENGPKKRKTKGRITVASLNMRGGNSGAAGDKWLRVNQVLRDKRIAVLALQETHLTNERLENMNELFKASMVILNSPDPENPSGARGVAFAVNTRIVATEDLKMLEIVPGRAAILNFRWTGDRVLRILNVYAPNGAPENATFWRDIKEKLTSTRGRRPEMLLGDFNLVEDSMDRLPPRGDQTEAVEDLGRLVGALGMTDGWRRNNPNARAFTYLQLATGSQSRIDRIYVPDELMQRAEDWEMTGPGFPTDHRIVSVSLANYKAPRTGKGRWAFPQVLLTDGDFARSMRKMGMELQADLESLGERTERRNPQILYHEFKVKLRAEARTRAKKLIPKIERRIAALEHDISILLEGEDPDKHEVAILQDRMMKLEVKRFERKRRAVATKDWLKGETVSRYWTKLNAPQLPTTSIFELRLRTNELGRSTYSSASEEMARTAKEHYDGLQEDADLPNIDQPEAIRIALEPMRVGLTIQQKGSLARRIKREEVRDAVRESPLGKAPGLDGIPAEVWKTYLKWEEKDEEGEREPCRMSRILRQVFNDIESHGVEDSTTFTDGWICPIYKLKKDQREIVNYRPITLLNADYKVMTRVMAVRLAGVADSLVQPDQAAFIPGRQIFSNIKLSRMVLEYAEAGERNGAIVALDQEKAYDMISHEYLWGVLRKLNFPENFIKTIIHLYQKAKSCVMVNGMQSDFYRIVRGVRQGDPMSCLLFVLAIEPLACALRESTLRGMEIMGDTERLITTLFADDTTVYLNETDSFKEMQDILDRWCTAARARFNVEKTEVLPVGTPKYRLELAERASSSILGMSIPASIKVVRDGELIRSLGAWIGNACDEDAPWIRMIQVLEKNLGFWTRRKPTLNGRKLIVGMEIGGRTQFLAKAQPMSEAIEKRLRTMVTFFMNNGDSHPRVGRDTLYKPVASGGLNLLDVVARNEAIDAVWLREYLLGGADRPRWAVVADAILARSTTAAARNVEDLAKVNTFTQTWSVSTHHSVGLRRDLRRMMKTATKYNLAISTNNPTEVFKAALPMWYHVGEADGRSLANTLSARCLREKHGVLTVGECAAVAERLSRRGATGSPHTPKRTCMCYECERDRTVKGCDDPHRCAGMAAKLLQKLTPLWKLSPVSRTDNLSLTPRRIRRNAEARAIDERVVFNPSVSARAPVESALRLFGPMKVDQDAVVQARRGLRHGGQYAGIEVHTDGSCVENGTERAVAACGVWFGEDDPRNLMARLPGVLQSNQAAEVFAIEEAVRIAPGEAPLHIVSDSRFAVDGVTVHLPEWEDRDWLGVKCAPLFRRAVARLRARTAETTLRWVKGHSGNAGNDGADALARAGLDLPSRQMLEMELSLLPFLCTGVRLGRITQRLAYAAVRRAADVQERDTTTLMVERA